MMPKAREVRIDGVGDDGSNKEEAVRGARQMWHRNGTRCPKELHSLSPETLNVACVKREREMQVTPTTTLLAKTTLFCSLFFFFFPL
jgi:hypothetical protein